MSELWDVYTIDRKLTGRTCIRGEQRNLSDDEFHLWVMAWIKNPETGKYLVSQRAADKDTDPLKWETVAGHSVVGDTSLDAVLREVYEEVGIELKAKDARLLSTKVALTLNGKRHNWIRDSFYFETTDEPDLNKATTNEVIQTKWLTFPEIKEMYERGECCFSMGDLYGFEANPVPADGYKDIIGRIVRGKIDRPMGSCHPEFKDMYYPVNYGYVTGVLGGDGEEQDVYLLGETSAVAEFVGKVIAVFHRYDDSETKWIVVPCDENGNVRSGVTIPTRDEIYAQTAFQEQFYNGVLVDQGDKMGIVYKKLTETELETFIDMRITQLTEEYVVSGREVPEGVDLKTALFDFYHRHMADGTFVSWLAMDGDKIIGTSGMSFVEKPPYFTCPSGKLGLLSSMYTNPDYRRKGIAMELLGRVVEEARAYGCGAVHITASDMGVKLYTAFGFKHNGNFMMYNL